MYLRDQGVIPQSAEAADASPLAPVLAPFRRYLRGAQAKAATAQDHGATPSCSHRPAGCGTATCPCSSRATSSPSPFSSRQILVVKNLPPRALLQFLFLSRDVGATTGSVLPAAGWRRRAAQGTRDDDSVRSRAAIGAAAVVTLRSALVSAPPGGALVLSDLDWRAGEIVVQEKAAWTASLLTWARRRRLSAASARRLRHEACSSPLSLPPGSRRRRSRASSSDGNAPGSRIGPHRLRHTAATQLLRAGAPMSEIGQVLRHEHTATTAVYAKVDLAALTPLAMPWPEVVT